MTRTWIDRSGSRDHRHARNRRRRNITCRDQRHQPCSLLGLTTRVPRRFTCLRKSSKIILYLILNTARRVRRRARCRNGDTSRRSNLKLVRINLIGRHTRVITRTRFTSLKRRVRITRRWGRTNRRANRRRGGSPWGRIIFLLLDPLSLNFSIGHILTTRTTVLIRFRAVKIILLILRDIMITLLALNTDRNSLSSRGNASVDVGPSVIGLPRTGQLAKHTRGETRGGGPPLECSGCAAPLSQYRSVFSLFHCSFLPGVSVKTAKRLGRGV